MKFLPRITGEVTAGSLAQLNWAPQPGNCWKTKLGTPLETGFDDKALMRNITWEPSGQQQRASTGEAKRRNSNIQMDATEKQHSEMKLSHLRACSHSQFLSHVDDSHYFSCG